MKADYLVRFFPLAFGFLQSLSNVWGWNFSLFLYAYMVWNWCVALSFVGPLFVVLHFFMRQTVKTYHIWKKFLIFDFFSTLACKRMSARKHVYHSALLKINLQYSSQESAQLTLESSLFHKKRNEYLHFEESYYHHYYYHFKKKVQKTRNLRSR